LIQALVADPFPETTRSKRRALLTASVIGIAVVRGGLLPDKIPFLGLEDLTIAEKQVLVLLLFALTTYYLVAFALYVGRDCLTLIAAYHSDVDNELVSPHATANEHQIKAIQGRQRFWDSKSGLRKTAWALAVPRWLLEVVFPIALGLYAVWALWP
jgi:hypothetical protein